MSRATGLLIVALLFAGTAAAQTQAYRCGADGRSYSQEPCDGGRPVELDDRRTALQAAQTHQAALADARRADELERARLHAERIATRHGPALIGSSPKAAQSEPSKRRHDKPDRVTLYRTAEAR